eukprot:CAMPEP_0184742604 /NCGR_PEP_ID=MMETSP0315-20130426/5557_1 /TAXON_ID=101924 /ORGANISM="Rhodosorus marinus, Strain UTEX LB 2760" /LENGTH=51 /DNA_ID=CAMNT_0027213501 /DNA_START=83 /DNA_END=234 /DNA_ORIENTATION=+
MTSPSGATRFLPFRSSHSSNTPTLSDKTLRSTNTAPDSFNAFLSALSFRRA